MDLVPVTLRVLQMLNARRKLWMSPLFLLAIALGAFTAKAAPEDRPTFIYTLF